MSSRVLKIVAMVLGGLALAFGLAFGLGFVVQALWNWLMPGIFGLPELTYWQAWGLFILAHILLGGGPRFHHSSDKHKNGFHNKFRETFHDKIRATFHPCCPPAKEEGEAPVGGGE